MKRKIPQPDFNWPDPEPFRLVPERVALTLAADIAEMMAGWNRIEAAAKAQFPNATQEELYEITKGAMNHALGDQVSLRESCS